MANAALAYAENTLGVHAVLEQATTARNSLDECLTLLSSERDNRRNIDAVIEDRRMELASDEHGKHPDMSAAGMEKHLRIVWAKDVMLKASRDKLNEVVGKIEGLEFDRSVAEADLKIATSRMVELGGYFEYLAAIKFAETLSKTKTEVTSSAPM